jgi:hypothetical protein
MKNGEEAVGHNQPVGVPCPSVKFVIFVHVCHFHQKIALPEEKIIFDFSFPSKNLLSSPTFPLPPSLLPLPSTVPSSFPVQIAPQNNLNTHFSCFVVHGVFSDDFIEAAV